MATMLYKYPSKNKGNFENKGVAKVDGVNFDYLIVEEEQIDTFLKKGYFKTTSEAKAKKTPSNQLNLPSREVLEANAQQLGITYAHNISDENLYAKITGLSKD